MHSQFHICVPCVAVSGVDADAKLIRDVFQLHPFRKKLTNLSFTR